MKKMKLNLGNDKMLSKDQMKKITGGDLKPYNCVCKYSSGYGSGFYHTCEEALWFFLATSDCLSSHGECYQSNNFNEYC